MDQDLLSSWTGAERSPGTRLPAEIFDCRGAGCDLRATLLLPMRVDLFSYELPADRIAQHPLANRGDARLLVLGPESADSFSHKTVAELASLVPSGAVVVINDTRVIPARLLGHKISTGGKVEIFLVRCLGVRTISDATGESRECAIWSALGKASKRLRVDGSDIAVGPIRIRVVGRNEGDGLLEVALWTTTGESLDDAISANGHIPLPPYIHRDDEPADRDRYQTVFARADGAVAAPTAGLHVTQALLAELTARGCTVVSVTLHVGLGTFQPVTVDDLDSHPMHAERYEIPEETAAAINAARASGNPIVAIGTTVVRALESAALTEQTALSASKGDTRLLIQPGFSFQIVDALFTNFHLSESTLLALVCAFAGRDRILGAYAEAIQTGYRFYSYGDAMFVWRQDT